MINTIKKILEFDISDDKKVELIKALVKDNITYTSGGLWVQPNGTMPLNNNVYPTNYCTSGTGKMNYRVGKISECELKHCSKETKGV